MLFPYELPPNEDVVKHTDVLYDELIAIADGCNANGSYKVLARRLFAEIEDKYNSPISIQHLTNLLEHIAHGKLKLIVTKERPSKCIHLFDDDTRCSRDARKNSNYCEEHKLKYGKPMW